jgi:hypothetical protein
MIAAYPKQICTAAVPVTPSSARFNTPMPYCFAFAERACITLADTIK